MSPRWKPLIIVMFCLSMIFLGIVVFATTAQEQQTTPDVFRELLISLNERVNNGFSFYIAFTSSANAEFVSVVVGQGMNEFTLDIKDDYICLYRLMGAALTVACYPFASIASVSYLDT